MNIINKISEFLDDHVRIVTNVGYALIGVGVLSIARRSRLLTKFSNASDVPSHFIHRGVKLHGVLKDLSLPNVVHIDHLPSFRKPNWLQLKPSDVQQEKYMKLGLAGVNLCDDNCSLLLNELNGKIVWFKLLSSERPMRMAPSAIIYRRKHFFLRNINVYAVKKGYGVVDNVSDCDQNQTQKHLQKSLFKAQKYAAKKKLGVWKE